MEIFLSDQEKNKLANFFRDIIHQELKTFLSDMPQKIIEEMGNPDTGILQGVHNNIDGLKNKVAASADELKKIQTALYALDDIKKEIDGVKSEIGDAKNFDAQLSEKNSQLAAKDKELAEKNDELAKKSEELENLQKQLDEERDAQNKEITLLQKDIEKINLQLEKTASELEETKKSLDKKISELDSKNAELGNVKNSLDEKSRDLEAWKNSAEIYAPVRDAMNSCPTFAPIIQKYNLTGETDIGLLNFVRAMGLTETFPAEIYAAAVENKKASKELMTDAEIAVYDALNKCYRQIWNVSHDIFALPDDKSVTEPFAKTKFDKNNSLNLENPKMKDLPYTVGVYVPVLFNRAGAVSKSAYVQAASR